jgi:hypothetical protein
MVKILNEEGDIIGTASAAGTTMGASRRTSVGGGQLNNFGSVSAAAGVTIDPDFAASASAHTIFDFWLQLVPPAGVPSSVALIVADRFDIGFAPGGGNAVAQVKISGDFGPSQPLLVADEFFNPVNTSVSHKITVPSDGILKVEMEAKANEYAAGGGMAEANADPSFQIDPSFPHANSFSFAISPDLFSTSIPEPNTFWFVLVCFSLAGFRYWQKRRAVRACSKVWR